MTEWELEIEIVLSVRVRYPCILLNFKLPVFVISIVFRQSPTLVPQQFAWYELLQLRLRVAIFQRRERVYFSNISNTTLRICTSAMYTKAVYTFILFHIMLIFCVLAKHTAKYETPTVHFLYFIQISCPRKKINYEILLTFRKNAAFGVKWREMRNAKKVPQNTPLYTFHFFTFCEHFM